jgi:hypothetical protein
LFFDQFADPVGFMGTEVVHHHNMTWFQFRAEHLFDVSQKDVAIGRLLDGHGRNHSASADGAQDGHDFPVAAGGGLVDATSSAAASPQPRHGGRNSAFIQINQPLRRDIADRLEELFAPLEIRFRVPLDGVERLFFRRSPSRTTQSRVSDQLISTPLSATIRSRSSATVRSESASTNSTMRSVIAALTRLFGPGR